MIPPFLLPILAKLSPLGPLFEGLWKLLSAPVSFRLPVWLLIVIPLVGWWQWNSWAAARVKAAVAELVAGEELAAAEAKADGLQIILDEQKRRAALAESARRQFETEKADAERQAEELSNELADLKSNPVNDRCDVDDGILDRLHNR